MNKVNIYEVTRVDMAGNKLQQNTLTEAEAIQGLKDRNDLNKNLTEQDIEGAFQVMRDNFTNNIDQPCFFLNDNQTMADVYTLIDAKTIH